MQFELKNKIPTTYMPDDWREIGAKKFTCSVNKIEKVVYGLTANEEIFDYMLGLAETGKINFELKRQEIAQRLDALND